MNDNKKFYNLKEVENKLHNFEEGKDYFVTPSREPEIKDYTFYNDRLKSLFGGNNWVPVRIRQEKYDDKNFSYRGHFEEGKDYSYSYQEWMGTPPADENGWRPIKSWHYSKGGTSGYEKGSIRGRKLGNRNEPKKIESDFNDNFFLPGNFENSDEEIKHQERLNGSRLRTIERDKKEFEDKLAYYESLPAEERANKDIISLKDKINFLRKEIEEEKDWINLNNPQQRGRMGRNETGKWITDKEDNNNSDLEKENQELRHQLAQVQAELAKVLTELKKLTGKGDKKLEQQQAENEKAIKQGSVAEIKAQVQKSQALMRETDTQTQMKGNASEKSEPGNGVLPYVAVGSLLVAGLGGVVYWWKKHSSKK